MIRCSRIVWLLPTLQAMTAAAQESEPPPYVLDPIVVTATRSPQSIADVPANVTVLKPDDLRLSASSRLDDVLRQVPGFSLLRQGSSVVTSLSLQGVSLRGLGPTNTGRTLVLLDGVPLNDPFSGHVTWSRIPLGSVERIEVVRGGGSTTWGSLALGGVIHILTHKPEGRALRFRGQGGGRGTRNFDLLASESAGPVTFSAGGGYYDTDGYRLWRADQLGEIDRPARMQSETLLGRVDYRASPRARFYLQGGYSAEDREKGTPLGRSDFITRSYDFGGDVTARSQGLWSFHLFAVSRSSRNFSSTVSSDRATERPTGDEYRAPCAAVGTNLQWSTRAGERHRISAGADHQWLDGESDALGAYSSSSGGFTTDRHVEGRTQILGFYLQDIFRPSVRWQLVASARFDVVRSFDARDVLTEIATGDVLTETRYTDETKTTLNPSLGVVHHLSDDFSLRASVYRAFRAPTISELYEGFLGRDGTVTVGNADLKPEQLVGGEAGVDFRQGRLLSTRITGFWNEVESTITQRTVGVADSDTDTDIPPCGLVPAGGVCRQTDNVGRLRSRGVELEADFRPHEILHFSGSYTFDDAVLSESDDASLVGNQVRNVARHQFGLRGSVDEPSVLSASVQARFVGDRFEDDRNTLPLDELFVVDLLVSRKATRWSEVFVSVENVFDTEFEVRKTTTGLVEVGAPRLVQGGVRLNL